MSVHPFQVSAVNFLVLVTLITVLLLFYVLLLIPSLISVLLLLFTSSCWPLHKFRFSYSYSLCPLPDLPDYRILYQLAQTLIECLPSSLHLCSSLRPLLDLLILAGLLICRLLLPACLFILREVWVMGLTVCMYVCVCASHLLMTQFRWAGGLVRLVQAIRVTVTALGKHVTPITPVPARETTRAIGVCWGREGRVRKAQETGKKLVNHYQRRQSKVKQDKGGDGKQVR